MLGSRSSAQQPGLSTRSIHSKQLEDELTAGNYEPIWNDVKYMASYHPNRLDPDLISKGMFVITRFRNTRRFQKENQEVMKILVDELLALQSVAKPRHFAIALCALTGVADKATMVANKIPEILAQFDKMLEEEVRKIPLEELCNVFWALKVMNIYNVPKVLIHAADHHSMNFSTKHLIAITWALVHLRISPPKSIANRLQNLSDAEVDLIRATDVQKIVNAMAKQKGKIPEAVKRRLQTIHLEHGVHYTSFIVSNLLWSLATLKEPIPHGIVQMLANKKDKNLRKYNHRDIATVIWAFSTLGQSLPSSIEQRLENLPANFFRGMSLRDVTSIADSCLNLGIPYPEEIVSRMMNITVHQVKNIKNFDIAKVVYLMMMCDLPLPREIELYFGHARNQEILPLVPIPSNIAPLLQNYDLSRSLPSDICNMISKWYEAYIAREEKQKGKGDESPTLKQKMSEFDRLATSSRKDKVRDHQVIEW